MICSHIPPHAIGLFRIASPAPAAHKGPLVFLGREGEGGFWLNGGGEIGRGGGGVGEKGVKAGRKIYILRRLATV